MDETPNPSSPVVGEWPQCPSCGHFLHDLTEHGGSWECKNLLCEEFT